MVVLLYLVLPLLYIFSINIELGHETRQMLQLTSKHNEKKIDGLKFKINKRNKACIVKAGIELRQINNIVKFDLKTYTL